MTLNEAETGREYIIKAVTTEDAELRSFLFTLGCFSGESITVVTRKRSQLVLSIKDARYNVDSGVATLISV